MTITYQAVWDVSARSVELLAQLLGAERVRRGTRTGTWALGVHQQALLMLRWFFDDVGMVALAQDNKLSRSAVYAYRDEGIVALAARRPSLHEALLAAQAAGHAHVIVDGTLIATDRLSTPGPTPGVDLWWSGKHNRHGGTI